MHLEQKYIHLYNVLKSHTVTIVYRVSEVTQRTPRDKRKYVTVGSLLWKEKFPTSEDMAMPPGLGIRDWYMLLYLPIYT